LKVIGNMTYGDDEDTNDYDPCHLHEYPGLMSLFFTVVRKEGEEWELARKNAQYVIRDITNGNVNFIISDPSITVIEEGTFSGCYNLVKLTAPNVSMVKAGAFENARNLREIISRSDADVAYKAFSDCYVLEVLVSSSSFFIVGSNVVGSNQTSATRRKLRKSPPIYRGVSRTSTTSRPKPPSPLSSNSATSTAPQHPTQLCDLCPPITAT